MLNTNDILETIQMITDEHLDVRTVTMGISLLDCIRYKTIFWIIFFMPQYKHKARTFFLQPL